MSRLLWSLFLLLPLACATPVGGGPTGAGAGGAASGVTQTRSRRQAAAESLPRTVRLFLSSDAGERMSASAVVFATQGRGESAVSYLLTNAHAVDPDGAKTLAFKVVVDRGPDSLEYPARLLASGHAPEMDLAVVAVEGVLLPVAQLATDDELAPGEEVLVVGAPFGRPLSVVGGMVSQVEWDPVSRTPKLLKTDAPIGYGSSGGGVFSLSTGHLLGLVEGYRTAKVGFEVEGRPLSFDVPMPGETFAAPASRLKAFLREKGLARLLESNPH